MIAFPERLADRCDAERGWIYQVSIFSAMSPAML